MTGRLGIDDVTPSVGDGRHPSKAVVGEVIPIGATVWREGHDAVAANVVWRKVGSRGPAHHVRMEQTGLGTDRFEAVVAADEQGLWTFRVDAWSDPWATWRNAVTKKLDAGPDPRGAGQRPGDRRAAAAAGRPPPRRAPEPRPALRRGQRAARHRAAAARAGRARAVPGRARDHDRAAGPRADHPRPFAAGLRRPRARPVRLLVRVLPRSTGGRDETGRAVHGTFVTAAKELDRVAAMGFDVVYLPPIHPVGTAHRKGRNNSVHAGPGDVGSPWAIGSAEGGHDAIDPELGTMEDFDAFVAARAATSAWRSRWTSRCSARRTTRGSRSTRSGSPCAPTARSPTRRTRRRSTRTSTRSTSTTTPRASTTSRCGSCCCGSSTACGSSGWTTRTPSRRTSGTG